MAKTFRYRLQPGTYERNKIGGTVTVYQVTEMDGSYHEFTGEGVERLGEVVDGELVPDEGDSEADDTSDTSAPDDD